MLGSHNGAAGASPKGETMSNKIDLTKFLDDNCYQPVDGVTDDIGAVVYSLARFGVAVGKYGDPVGDHEPDVLRPGGEDDGGALLRDVLASDPGLLYISEVDADRIEFDAVNGGFKVWPAGRDERARAKADADVERYHF